MWRLRASLIREVLLVSGVTASTAWATTLTWSGPASPCGSTLQACIDGALPGSIIQVATNSPIFEDLTIDKSLTLRAAQGFTPVFDGFVSILVLNPNPRANRVALQRLTLTNGRVRALQNSTGAFDVTMRELTIQNTSGGPEIGVQSNSPGPLGPVVFAIVDNELTIPPDSQLFGGDVIGVGSGDAISWRGVIQGNRIDHFDGGQRPAIGVYNANRELDVDVIANEIRGANYNNGIFYFQFGNGTSHVRMIDNLVVGQVNEAGAPGAYVVNVSGGSSTFEIVNNTAVHGDIGILVGGRDDLGASWSGVIANNIVAHMRHSGIGIQYPTQTSGIVEDDHNLFFDAPWEEFTPGPGTLIQDPRFMGGANYRLSFGSPARNQGSDARVPADLTTDLDGSARRVGHVDMGAYESTTTVATPLVLPAQYGLHPNVPNPFNPSTTIRYELPRSERVRLGVFDVQGKLVRWLVAGAQQGAGLHRCPWDGRSAHGVPMPSGIYFYRLEAGRFVATRRMVLTR